MDQRLWTLETRDRGERDARLAIERFFLHWETLPRAAGALAPHIRTFLDRPNPAVQPRVALVDVVPPERMYVRLFATDRENTLGRNLTGENALDVYPPEIRHLLWRGAEAVVGRPCGWLTERIVTSAAGASTRFLSISLPLLTDPDAAACLVNYTFPINRVEDKSDIALVNAVSPGRWIDLGAGVPHE
ncbi:MAG: hypothetical protein SFV21_14200 [Rhodospirillaceae bacterium]|nr:hypothetical protein [Rhodospirillaceae bacterium]